MATKVTAVAALALTTVSASAQLVGSGANLPIPSPNGPPNAVAPTITPLTGGFEGTWNSPAAAPWLGTFKATGPIPSGTANPIGITRYDFSTLPTGDASTGTIIFIGDVDGGSSTTETYTLRAFDSSGSLITSAWLDTPYSVIGTGTGGGGSIAPIDMPSWSWTSGTGEYFFSGAGVTGGNPTIGVYMETLTDIRFLEVTRTSQFTNFAVLAPQIPSPAGAGALALGGLLAVRRRR